MSPQSIVNALVVAASASSRITGPLHTLHYYWPELTARQRAAALADARENAEELLASIKDAQASLAANDLVAA